MLAHTPPADTGIPPVFGVSVLSELIQKSPASILADRSRAPHRVPPSCEPPGSRQPLWILADVLDWLRHYQRPSVPPPAATAPDTPRRRGPGRPPKAEQARRAAAAQAQKGGAQ
ncbi:hypothetical protein [Thiobacillus denitrificans]|nr:hypothetical protein [Thiobacillus denitrificans]